MKSPCVLVCRLDLSTGYCVGCGRTGSEIGDWIGYSDDERQAVMKQLTARLSQIDEMDIQSKQIGSA